MIIIETAHYSFEYKGKIEIYTDKIFINISGKYNTEPDEYEFFTWHSEVYDRFLIRDVISIKGV